MASRFSQQKPDPTIKKNVIRSRQGAKGAKRAQGFVVAASLALTMMGWAFFSHEDAQTAVTAQLANPTPVAASAQQTASSSPTSLVTSVSQTTNEATATPVAVAVK